MLLSSSHTGNLLETTSPPSRVRITRASKRKLFFVFPRKKEKYRVNARGGGIWLLFHTKNDGKMILT